MVSGFSVPDFSSFLSLSLALILSLSLSCQFLSHRSSFCFPIVFGIVLWNFESSIPIIAQVRPFLNGWMEGSTHPSHRISSHLYASLMIEMNSSLQTKTEESSEMKLQTRSNPQQRSGLVPSSATTTPNEIEWMFGLILFFPFISFRRMVYLDSSSIRSQGPGLEGSMAGAPGVFWIRARDKDGNPIFNGGAKFECLSTFRCEVTDHGNGSYTGNYRSTVSGSYRLKIGIGSEEIRGSPFRVSIRSAPGSTAKSEIRGSGKDGEGREGKFQNLEN